VAIKAYRGPRFNDDVLVVGLDVAKHRHVSVAEAHGRFSKPLPVGNDWAGFEALESWARRAAAGARCASLVFALESTGHYHKPLEEWLTRRGHEVRFVSTLATSRAKALLDDATTKTDEKDACVIADLARHGKSLPIAAQEERYAELRYLGEFRQRLTEEKTQCLNRLHRLLDLCFPELPGLFSELDGRALRALLAKAFIPEEVAALGVEGLAELLRKASRGRFKRDRAEQVLAAAEKSVGCRRGVKALKLEMSYQLGRLDELEARLAEVERELEETAAPIPYYRELAAIPHLGEVTVAVLLGELGDVRKYRHANQLVKKAGLTLTERSSGKHKGKRRISKRGRAQARQMLYLAAIRMMKQGAPLHNLRANHPGKPKTTLAVMGMRRILRMVFALVHKGGAFDRATFEVKLAEKASEKLAA
jgi:transposase